MDIEIKHVVQQRIDDLTQRGYYCCESNLSLSGLVLCVSSPKGKEIICANCFPFVESIEKAHFLNNVEETMTIFLWSPKWAPLKLQNISRNDVIGKGLEQKIPLSSGYNISPEGRNGFQNAILAQLDPSIKMRNTYSFTGRVPQSEKFVFYNQTVLSPATNFIATEQQAFQFVWNASQQVLSQSRAQILLVQALLALCCSSWPPEVSLRPSAAIYLLGESGSKKTSLCTALLAAPFYKAADANFKSTEAAVQRAAMQTRDKIFIVDDAYPPKSREEKNVQRKILSLVLRAVGDAGGMRQTVLTSSNGSRQWDCLPIFTGEYLVPCSHSDIWRMLQLKLNKNDVNLDVLTQLQQNPEVLNTFYQGFIQHIVLNPMLLANVSQRFEEIRCSKNRFPIDIPDRLSQTIAWMHAGMSALALYGTHIGALTQEDAYPALDTFQKDLFCFAKRQVDCYSDTGTLTRLLDLLFEVCESSGTSLVRLAQGENGILIAQDGPNCIGYFDDYLCYLKTDVFWRQACQRTSGDDFDITQGLSARGFRKLLWDNKLVDSSCHSEKSLTKNKRVNGCNYRVTVLSKKALERFGLNFTMLQL